MRASMHPKPGGASILGGAPPRVNADLQFQPLDRLWSAAWQRVERLEPQVATACRALLAHLESAREPLNRLRAADRRARRRRGGGEGVEHVLLFVTSDVLDLFALLMHQVSYLVPGLRRWKEYADPMGADGTATLFDRHLRVLRSAAFDPCLPEELADAILVSAAALDGWYADFERLLDTVDEHVIAPVRTRFPVDEPAGTP